MRATRLADGDIPAYWRALGLPGLADIHIHFLPQPMLEKVWAYFDEGERTYGMAWPVHYRLDEPKRLALLRRFGVRAISSRTYPHKPGMAQWLNDWCAEFARRVPDAVRCATLYPEDDVGDYVKAAVEGGARLFKMHVQVEVFRPDDVRLDPAWGALEDAQVPVVLHAGSGPKPGKFTGPGPVRALLRRHPRLVLVSAHLGMSEYHEFADLAENSPSVRLDTTMAGTTTSSRARPAEGLRAAAADLGDKVVRGSDFPNIPYPYAHQLEALDRLDLGDDWL